MRHLTIVGIASFTIFLILILASFMNYTWSHEQAHQQIYKNYGVESEIEYGFFGLNGGVTKPNYQQANRKCDDFCQLAQRQVDSFGYQTQPIIATLWAVLISYMTFTVLMQVMKEERN